MGQGTAAARQPLQATVVWLLCAFLFVLPFTSSIFARNLLLGLATAALLFRAARSAASRARMLPPLRLLIPLAAWSLWCAASVAWSVDPAYSASELRPGLLYPAVAFLVFYAATDGAATMDRWARSLALGLAILGPAAVVVQVVTGKWDPRTWHGGHGAYSVHATLALPLLAWAFLRTQAEATLARWSIAFATVLGLAALWLIDIRMSWLALALMTAVGAVLWVWIHGLPRSRGTIAIALATVAAFLALFALALLPRSPAMLTSPIAATRELSRDPRIALWQYSFERIGDAPWIGHGYGKLILENRFRDDVRPHHPSHLHGHNVLLNVTMQTGLVGLALFAWMLGELLRPMVAGLAAGPPARAVAVLGLVLVAGFALRNMVDDFLVRQSALLAWALAGAVLGALRDSAASQPDAAAAARAS